MTLYRTAGLLIASEQFIPEMIPSIDEDPADAHIRIDWGENIPSPPGQLGENGTIETKGMTSRLTLPAVGRFVVTGGCHIVVNPGEGVSPIILRQYLLGTVLAAALFQRGAVPLHISAVVTPKGVWAFTGDSGAGKSTLAGLLNVRNGWPIVSDDMAALNVDTGAPMVHSGIQRIKLEQAVADSIGFREEAADGVGYLGKRHLVAPSRFVAEPQPLKALVELTRADTPTFTALSGLAAVQLFLRAIYRREIMHRCVPANFSLIRFIEAMSTVRTIEFARPWTLTDNTALRELEERIKAC